ncbi:MAG: hypothetical protein E6I80_16705 [Chloroflexi bacterium]|nr:MAG: hypothetical protein E6I80_16705 [Chloroflexota bacterium]
MAKQRREATGSPQCVGGARTVCWRAGELCGSNPARAAVRYSLGADATADFPGAAWPSRRRSIDEAFVVDRNDSSGCWLHPPHAGSRRLLGVAHGGTASGQQTAQLPIGLESKVLAREAARFPG